MNQDENAKFELLLTPAALNVSNKLKFQLPPIAEPGEEFSVGSPVFGSIREKLCFVEAEFVDSKTESLSPLTIMLRKTKSGWRVAGMLVDGDAPDAMNLLSFESTDDVAQIKSSIENISSDIDHD